MNDMVDLLFNATDSSWPRLGMGGERVLVGSEGWIFAERYKNSTQWVEFLSHDAAISGSLQRFGIKAQLSEPRHIPDKSRSISGGPRFSPQSCDPERWHRNILAFLILEKVGASRVESAARVCKASQCLS